MRRSGQTGGCRAGGVNTVSVNHEVTLALKRGCHWPIMIKREARAAGKRETRLLKL